MSKTLQKYIKYTERELEEYAEAEGSCVKKVNTQWHLALAPYALNNIKDSILTYIRRKKVGSFDIHLNGIILEIKNIKLLGVAGALRADDPRMHVKVKADCYIFQPEVGAILSGIVRHIGKKHVGALIYRVFNANLRFETKVNENLVKLDSEIKFRINDFNLQNVFPYIEGEILSDRPVASKNNITKMDSDSTIDSGIEERDSNELDNIINLIKQEPMSEAEGTKSPAKKLQKSNKKKRELSESTETSTKRKNKEKKPKLVDKKNETKFSKSVNMSITSVQIKKEPTN